MGNNGIIGRRDDWRAIIFELPTKKEANHHQFLKSRFDEKAKKFLDPISMAGTRLVRVF